MRSVYAGDTQTQRTRPCFEQSCFQIRCLISGCLWHCSLSSDQSCRPGRRTCRRLPSMKTVFWLSMAERYCRLALAMARHRMDEHRRANMHLQKSRMPAEHSFALEQAACRFMMSVMSRREVGLILLIALSWGQAIDR